MKDNEEALYKEVDLVVSELGFSKKKLKADLFEGSFRPEKLFKPANGKSTPGKVSVWQLAWDAHSKSEILKLNRKVCKISNKMQDGRFHSACTDQGFTTGIHIWRYRVALDDNGSVCMGVTKTKMFFTEGIFTKENFGFGVTNRGCSKNGSFQDPRFAPALYGDFDILMKLDMLNGVLFYSFDKGNNYLEAFRSNSLTVGPIYPAISIRNRGQVTLLEA